MREERERNRQAKKDIVRVEGGKQERRRGEDIIKLNKKVEIKGWKRGVEGRESKG